MSTPSRPGRRWEIERAIDDSDLHPFGRLLLRVLLSNSDADTALIQDRYQPSIPSLMRRTGIGRRALIQHLSECDRRGWLKRDQARGRRTRYEVVAPSQTE